MTTQEFADGQAATLEARLLEEFPDRDVWAKPSRDYREMQFRVNDCTGRWNMATFGLEAIEEIVASIHDLLDSF